MKINIDSVEKYDSTIYIADIQLKDASYLKTALANDVFGKNIKETTSEIAADHNAIFAVNGDFYGFRNSGYVLRNGALYRDTAADGEDNLDGGGCVPRFSAQPDGVLRQRGFSGFL